ncbi:HrgA protein [Campylobacter sp. faydin G-140]|uniref:HTH domain-containing protein n=1 Tax=Campylobacter anatolicus TaxID=2829105 RepID=UPI001B9C40B9|nr:HTH domain-containing protein [Campylobacter anatolicus]MBR8466138.1 HrgA protein [Campylobacter anatolicus]
MTIFEVAKKVLEDKKVALSPNRIYKLAEEMRLVEQLNLKGKTPWQTFSAYIYIDLKNNPNSIFEKVSQKPILIKLKNQNSKEPRQEAIQELKDDKFIERDLHPLLVKFIYSNENFNARAKTIFHENSKKQQKGHDRWLYPDIVGVSFEAENYEKVMLGFISKFNQIPIKLFSFEMKKFLSVGNFREYYFQAVSNSSWANEGYLVALNIDESDTELIELIQKLNLSFGIGVISLDSENIAQSKVIAPAKFKDALDMNIMNELTQKNKNFNSFLKTIKDFESENQVRFEHEFDEILDHDKFEKYLKEKGIKKC